MMVYLYKRNKFFWTTFPPSELLFHQPCSIMWWFLISLGSRMAGHMKGKFCSQLQTLIYSHFLAFLWVVADQKCLDFSGEDQGVWCKWLGPRRRLDHFHTQLWRMVFLTYELPGPTLRCLFWSWQHWRAVTCDSSPLSDPCQVVVSLQMKKSVRFAALIVLFEMMLLSDLC